MRPLEEGSLVGRYRVGRLLGLGGMGAVHEARDERDGHAVALKVVAPELTADPAFQRRFGREARSGTAIDHPNVVKVLDAGTSGGVGFIALELLGGGSLSERIARGGALPWREAVALGAQIARGLAAIHGAGFFHRDVKPANVLFDSSGVAKVADLGLAGHDPGAARSIGGALTKTGELLGTPSYMAPEQAGGEKVDARADLYALGAVLHAMVAGQPPFAGEGYAVIAKHLREPPPRLRALVPGTPASLEDLVLRLLEKEPRLRPGSALEVAEELRAIGEERGEGRPRRRLAAALLALLVVAGGALAVARRGPRDIEGAPPSPPTGPPPSSTHTPPTPGTEKDEAPLRLRSTLGQRTMSSRGVATALALAPGGEVAWVGLEGARVVGWRLREREPLPPLAAGFEDVKGTVSALALAGDGDRLLVGSDGLACLRIADGKTLWTRADLPVARLAVRGSRAFVVAKGDVHVLDIEKGGANVALWHPDPREGNAVTACALSPDGTEVAIGNASGQVWTALVADGKFQLRGTTTGWGSPVRDLVFVNDSAVASVHGAVGDKADLVLWPRGEEPHIVHAADGDLLACAASPSGRLVAFAGADRRVRVVDLEYSGAGTFQTEPGESLRTLTGLAFVSEARLLSTGRDGVLREWDVKAKEELPATDGHRDAVTRVCWMPRGARALSASADGTVKLWDTESGRALISRQLARTFPLTALAVHPDGAPIVVGSGRRPDPYREPEPFKAAAWALDAALRPVGEPIAEHGDRVTGVAAVGDRVMTVSPDGRLRIRDGGGAVHPLPLEKALGALAVAGDGSEALVAGEAGIWRIDLADILHQRSDYAHPPGHRLTAVAYSARGECAASVDEQGLLALWDLKLNGIDRRGDGDARPFFTRERAGRLHDVAFLPGERVVTAGDDGSLRVHSYMARKTEPERVTTLPSRDVPLSLSVSPDGKELLVGTARGVVLRYEVR